MRRTSRDNGFHGEPIEKIELDESNVRRRVIVVILALLIAGVSIGYGISQLTKSNKGWNVIQVNSSSQVNSGVEFTFSYYLGLDGSPTAERKALTLLYSRLCEEAYQTYDIYNDHDGLHNLCYINEHPNEMITVSDKLYQSLKLINDHQDRHMFLGPIYELYSGVLYADSDTSARVFDPLYSDEYRQLYDEILPYVNDPESVNIELVGSDQVRLNVSADYISFCQKNDLHHYLDLNWMRNAFVADYIADELIANGYTHGRISSIDGYARVLGEYEFEYYMFDYVSGERFQVGNLNHEAANAYVMLKSFPLNDRDYDYHIYEDGSIRTAHLRLEDGQSVEKDARDYIGYSAEHGCAEVLMNVIPAYFSDPLSRIEDSRIWYVYINDNTVYYSNPADETMKTYETYQRNYVGS